MNTISLEHLLQHGVASLDGDIYNIEDVMAFLGASMSPEDILIMEEEGNLLDMMGVTEEEEECSESAATDSELGSFATLFSSNK